MRDRYSKLLESVAILGDTARAEEAVKKLVAHLRATGKLTMLPQIVRELKTVAARRAQLSPHVEVAHLRDAEQALLEARAAGIDAKKATVNHALISGWRARSAGAVVDKSGKRALLEIYTRVVASTK